MHAILSELNKQDIHAYARIVYRLATCSEDELEHLVPMFTWIVSCASHTMHRFVKALRELVHNSDQKELICYAFSVMMNAKDLETLCAVFTELATVLIVPQLNSACGKALQTLDQYITERPDDKLKVRKILTGIEQAAYLSALRKRSEENEDESEIEEEDGENEGDASFDAENFENDISLDNQNVEKVFTTVQLDDKDDDVCQFYSNHNEMFTIKVDKLSYHFIY
jgi:hypothetical protein